MTEMGSEKSLGGPWPLLEAINAFNEAELTKETFKEQARLSHVFKVDPVTIELINP